MESQARVSTSLKMFSWNDFPRRILPLTFARQFRLSL